MLRPYIKSSLKYKELDIVTVDDARSSAAAGGAGEGWNLERIDGSEPGAPTAEFWNVKE